MAKKSSKFLNIISFGLINHIAKKKASSLEASNSEFTLNTLDKKLDLQGFFSACPKQGILSVSGTISSITVKLRPGSSVDFDSISKFSAKGAIKNTDGFVLLVGDCAQRWAAQIQEAIKQEND